MHGQHSQIIVTGQLSKDPEMRYTPKGQAVTNISIPVNRYTGKDDNGQALTRVIWHNISLWGKTAESVAKFCKKGDSVTVVGFLTGDETGNPKTFTRNDGSIGSKFEIMANEIRFIETQGNAETSNDADSHNVPALPPEDDIPF